MADDGKLKWVTLFDNLNAKAEEKAVKKIKKPSAAPPKGDGDLKMDVDLPTTPPAGAKPQKKGGRLSVERIYQKKTQLEHILLRPDTYIGSVETVTQPMWVMDQEENKMVNREVTYVPGLYKIFDEILVNAADNKQRDPKMNTIKIDINPELNKIKIWNNGKGIPVIEHKTEKMYVPSLIFGHLLTSSNYNDEEQKVTGGRNGYGAKLCNIFSTKFIVETSSNEYKRAFKQTWTNNMTKTTDAKIIDSKGDDYTSITFFPDLEKFKMEKLDQDVVDIFTRRAYDIAASTKGVKVILNGKKLPVNNFRQYVDLYVKGRCDDNDQPLKVVHEVVNDRWEIAVTLSDSGFKQASFVNSIATTKGGRHIDHVVDQLVSKVGEVVKKKQGKGGVNIKPFQIKSHMWVFVNCLIVNPSFDSQTKENMTLQMKSFGSKCTMSDKFVQQVTKCGIVESIMSWVQFKAKSQLQKKCHSSKHSKLKGIPKLDDANDAGTKNSHQCTLILTEGDSAKTLAVSGLGVVGRDHYGVFPLRGKMLNVREATHKQIMENAEINNVIKIMGLQYKKKYDDPDSLKTLRYGKLMIMTDQDQDGSHIKGLLINFIHHNWPELLRHKFLEEFITPIVKVSKNKVEKSFYSLPEFEEWKNETDNWHTWKVKYYKGLGTSTAKEAKEYFSDMQRHRIPFKYQGGEDDSAIMLAFSKKKVEERKEWLTNWMEERKRRTELGLPELYLYGKDTTRISYNDFVNRELVLFSNMDNERSIPSLVDGFKPGQRKVIYACFKRNLTKELKVAQLAGSVAEHSAYHHGENSLMGTIINLAQNFVGSNNLNLLQPIGQFGTRLHGGKDAASPRYIFTCLSTLSRMLFHASDDPLLKHNFDDGQRIEPEFYVPIIPMVLVNGADGIGTGWSTKIPNYDVREIVANLKRLLNEEEIKLMSPSFKNFKGSMEELDHQKYVCSGEISILDDQTVEITELPVRTWTQQYKENVLEPMLHGTEKTPSIITDYKEYHTDSTVKFVVKMPAEKLLKAEAEGLHKVFKLQTTINTSTMVLFDNMGILRRFESPEQILKEFYAVRLNLYERRKEYMEGQLAAESLKLENQARFICEKIDGIISIENKPKKELIQMLVRNGYDSDPVKAWKDAQDKHREGLDADVDEEEMSQASSVGGGPDFNYILNMPLWSLSKEKKEELLKQRDDKAEELRVLRGKTHKQLWREDLEAMLKELERVEQIEREEESNTSVTKAVKTAKGRATKVKKYAAEETLPSPHGRRVAPRIDAGMVAKVEAAKKSKERKAIKKEELAKQRDMLQFLDDDDDNDENNEPKSLADRLGTKALSKPAAPKAKKQTTLDFKKTTKKKKGRNPWSDESDASEPEDMSDLDTSISEPIPVKEKTTPRRAAAAKVKYNYDDSDEEKFSSDDDDGQISKDDNSFQPSRLDLSDDEDDFVAPKKAQPSKPAVVESDDDMDVDSRPSQDAVQSISSDDEPVQLPPSPPPAKKEPAKKKTLGKKATTVGKKKVDNAQLSIFAAFSKSSKKSSQSSTTQSSRATSQTSDNDDVISIASSTGEQKKKQTKNKPAFLDSDDEDKPKPAKKPRKPKKATNSDDESAPKKSKKRPKKAFVDSDDSDDDFGAKKSKKRAKKKNDSDVSDDEFVPTKPKKSTAAKKKKAASSDEDDDLEISEVAPRERVAGGRARAPVKYNFGDSDDDEDDDY